MRGLAPMVLTADCLPIAIAGGGAVAMLHAGWRGLAGGVIAEGVAARCASSARRGALTAAIGPGAGPCCYEVGDEVHAAFAAYGERARNGRNLDLKAIARAQLERAGVARGPRRRAVHDLLRRHAVLLPPPRPRRHRPPGGGRVVDLIHGLDADRVRANLARIARRDRRRRARPGEVEILAAVKYVPGEELGDARGGRGRRWSARTAPRTWSPRPTRTPGRFTWDFIGHLQSRKVRAIVPYVALHPLGRQRLGAGAARAPRDADDRGPGRGQRRRRGGQGRGRCPPSCRRSSSAVRSRSSG